jgi:hypothetical protein
VVGLARNYLSRAMSQFYKDWMGYGYCNPHEAILNSTHTKKRNLVSVSSVK